MALFFQALSDGFLLCCAHFCSDPYLFCLTEKTAFFLEIRWGSPFFGATVPPFLGRLFPLFWGDCSPFFGATVPPFLGRLFPLFWGDCSPFFGATVPPFLGRLFPLFGATLDLLSGREVGRASYAHLSSSCNHTDIVSIIRHCIDLPFSISNSLVLILAFLNLLVKH